MSQGRMFQPKEQVEKKQKTLRAAVLGIWKNSKEARVVGAEGAKSIVIDNMVGEK